MLVLCATIICSQCIFAITKEEIINGLDSVEKSDPEGKCTLEYCQKLDDSIDQLLEIGEGMTATSLTMKFLDAWKNRWGFGTTYTYFMMREAETLYERGRYAKAKDVIDFTLEKLCADSDPAVVAKCKVVGALIYIKCKDLKLAETLLNEADAWFAANTTAKSPYKTQKYKISKGRYELYTEKGEKQLATQYAKKEMEYSKDLYGKDSEKYNGAVIDYLNSCENNFTKETNDLFADLSPQYITTDISEEKRVRSYFRNKINYIELLLGYHLYFMSQDIADSGMTDEDRKSLLGMLYALIDTSGKMKASLAEVASTETGKCYNLEAEIAGMLDLYPTAESAMQIVCRIEKMLSGSLSANTLMNTGLTELYIDKIDESRNHLRECLNTISEETLRNFRTMTSSERANYWNATYPLLDRMLTATVEAKESSRYAELGYDALLLSKGLLLNSEVELQNLINSSNDETLKSKFREWNRLLNKIEVYTQIQDKDYVEKINQLKSKAEKLESELVSQSKVFGDFTSGFDIDCEKIKSTLKKGDVAIEFAEVMPANIVGDKLYCAYILTPDATVQMVNLGTLSELGESGSAVDYTQLYKFVWAPILKVAKNAKNIYFSPAGILNNIGIEYAEGCDKYAFYRLSSTKELAMAERSKAEVGRGVAYGGILYDIDVAQMQRDSRKYGLNRSATITLGKNRASDETIDYLPGTLTEVKEIAGILSSHNVPMKLYTDSIGTETSVKSLEQKGINVMHFATHGFYKDYFEALEEGSESIDNIMDFSEDRALRRSGLLLSGAENVLNGSAIPSDTDDGVLTSYEISRLHFDDLQLVVLSACETGLGDVTDEGAAGLVRGLKNAGVHTILATLWSVDDTSTSIFMQKFYEALAEGKSKTEALYSAQQVLQNDKIKFAYRKFDAGKLARGQKVSYYERDFSEPYYWAPFILIDDL